MSEISCLLAKIPADLSGGDDTNRISTLPFQDIFDSTCNAITHARRSSLSWISRVCHEMVRRNAIEAAGHRKVAWS